MAIFKEGTSHWPDNDKKMTSHINFKLRFSKRSLDLVRGFILNLMWFETFGCQWWSCKWKMTILKQVMSDWPGNDRIMTSHSNFKLRYSETSLDVVRGFFVSIWCDLRSLVTRGNHLVESWLSYQKECHIDRATTEKWRQKATSN